MSVETVEREFITPRMAAKIIGTRVETVHGWIRDGELPASDLSKSLSHKPCGRDAPALAEDEERGTRRRRYQS